MKLLAIMLLVTGQVAPDNAVTECTVPQVPAVVRLSKPARPVVPSCVDEARNRHTCRASVISAYNGQLENYGRAFDRYVSDMNGYVDALNRYVDEVSRYTVCERDAAGVVTGVIMG